MKLWTILCAFCVLSISWGVAQSMDVKAKPLTDADMQLLRSDVQADKNDIIAQTMQFTDAESQAFWPLYRNYARDQKLIGDERVQ
jgi:hypothetical protein